MDLLLPLPLSDGCGLVLGESSAESASELGTEVKREVRLVLVEQTELGALVGVDDGENASDRLADVVTETEKTKNISIFSSLLVDFVVPVLSPANNKKQLS